MDLNSIRSRPGTEDDLGFLFFLQREAMRTHLERVYGPWNEEARRERFYAKTDPATHAVIELAGKPVGCQWVRRHPDALELVRLYLMPEAQGRGIGTHLVEMLLEEAQRSGLRVRLRVLKGNPAKRLYERLGFRVTREIETHHYMEAD